MNMVMEMFEDYTVEETQIVVINQLSDKDITEMLSIQINKELIKEIDSRVTNALRKVVKDNK